MHRLTFEFEKTSTIKEKGMFSIDVEDPSDKKEIQSIIDNEKYTGYLIQKREYLTTQENKISAPLEEIV